MNQVTRSRLLAIAFGCVSALAVGEIGARTFFRVEDRGFEQTRLLLVGEVTEGGETQNSVGQPYLLYAPTPNLRRGANYHNDQGYRGPAVTLERQPTVARVLCLGGSTTYGWGVDAPEDAYPAILETLLNDSLPSPWTRLEVINGGLPWGTSAELLTHYQFKFSYYQPDVVVINTGGNDGEAATASHYQPDYSHWRKPLLIPEPYAPWGRAVLRSRLAAWVLIGLTIGESPGSVSLMRREGDPPPTAWYPTARTGLNAETIADSQLAYARNLESLLTLLRTHGAVPVLVPFRIAPDYLDKLPEAAQILRNERLLLQIAQRQSVAVASFPADTIEADDWIDNCHLNAQGNLSKAEHIAPVARRALEQASSMRRPPPGGDTAQPQRDVQAR